MDPRDKMIAVPTATVPLPGFRVGVRFTEGDRADFDVGAPTFTPWASGGKRPLRGRRHLGSRNHVTPWAVVTVHPNGDHEVDSGTANAV